MSSTGYEMSSSAYESVYEGFNLRDRAKAAAKKLRGAAKKVGSSVKKGAGAVAKRAKAAAKKLRGAAKKVGSSVKKGAGAVAKRAKAAASWVMWYIRAAQIIFVILLIAYLYKTFVK